MGAAIHQNQLRLALQKQQELNDYLLNVIKCYFGDTRVGLEKMLTEIISFAKTTLVAESGALYIIDHDTDELSAYAFEEGIDDPTSDTLYRRNTKIRFNPETGGIAGYVARTHEAVNIMDAYSDPRFNRDLDEKKGFISRSLLCIPIIGVNGILGVIQVINKKIGASFTTTDEDLLNTFASYIALVIHYENINKTMLKTRAQTECYLDMLEYHIKPCTHDSGNFESKIITEDSPSEIDTFRWYITPQLEETMPQLVLYMVCEVVGEADIEFKSMAEFILSVKKSYRKNPYHSFEHAFNVCHCMYNILKRNQDIFTHNELKCLMVAALCHDLDHGGYTNNFLLLVDHTFARLYDESFLENHHFLVTMTIMRVLCREFNIWYTIRSKIGIGEHPYLQAMTAFRKWELHDLPSLNVSEIDNITEYQMFSEMSDGVFNEMQTEIKSLILATDLATYFQCRTKLIQVWYDHAFDWNNVGHRTLLKALMMTACDLSGQCKPYNIAKKITESVYKEFYHQGDIEKSMGLTPLSMMDREKQHLIPEDQVQFLSVVVIPCVELLYVTLPNTKELVTEAKQLRECWAEIIELRDKKCWSQEDSVVAETDVE